MSLSFTTASNAHFTMDISGSATLGINFGLKPFCYDLSQLSYSENFIPYSQILAISYGNGQKNRKQMLESMLSGLVSCSPLQYEIPESILDPQMADILRNHSALLVVHDSAWIEYDVS